MNVNYWKNKAGAFCYSDQTYYDISIIRNYLRGRWAPWEMIRAKLEAGWPRGQK